MSHSVDLIYIQESNLNLSSSFRIPGFSALQSHGTHSRSGIFSTDVADASGSVIIFVKQGLFFSELSTSSLSSLGPYSDYGKVNISLNDSSSLSFLNVYVPPIHSSTKDSRTNFFSFSILPSYVEAVDFSRFRFHRKVLLPPLPHPCLEPHQILVHHQNSPKTNMFCAISKKAVYGPFFFEGPQLMLTCTSTCWKIG